MYRKKKSCKKKKKRRKKKMKAALALNSVSTHQSFSDRTKRKKGLTSSFGETAKKKKPTAIYIYI